jgi:hypothetical protein
MALLDAKEFNFGRQNIWAATVGASDIPSTNTSGVIQVGDLIRNLSGTIGQPEVWVCTTAGTSPVWTSAGIVGTNNASRSVAVNATLASTDRYLFVTAAASVTLPAPTSTLNTHSYDIKATAQPVTITAASGGNLDGVTLGSIYLSTNQDVTLYTDGLTNWYTVGRDYSEHTNTPGAAYTLSPLSDRYILAQAGTITVPAPASWPLGQTFTIYATASSVTIAPASGNINGVAAVTLAANHAGTYFTDGTNFFAISL